MGDWFLTYEAWEDAQRDLMPYDDSERWADLREDMRREDEQEAYWWRLENCVPAMPTEDEVDSFWVVDGMAGWPYTTMIKAGYDVGGVLIPPRDPDGYNRGYPHHDDIPF